MMMAAVGGGAGAKLPWNPSIYTNFQKKNINRRFRDKNMHTLKLDEEQLNYEYFYWHHS